MVVICASSLRLDRGDRRKWGMTIEIGKRLMEINDDIHALKQALAQDPSTVDMKGVLDILDKMTITIVLVVGQLRNEPLFKA